MSGVRWRGLSHEEIYASVWNGPGPEGSADAQVIWNQVSARLREIDGILATEMARIAGGWEGAAASAASGALTPLGSWTSDATGDALLTANGLTGQAEQVAWVRGNLPPPAAPGLPEEPPSGLNDPGLDPYFLADWHEADAVRNEAAAQAVHVMETYQGNAGMNQGNLYYWTPPPAVTAEVAATGDAEPGRWPRRDRGRRRRRGGCSRSGRGGDRARTALRGAHTGASSRRRSGARRRPDAVARRRYRRRRRRRPRCRHRRAGVGSTQPLPGGGPTGTRQMPFQPITPGVPGSRPPPAGWRPDQPIRGPGQDAVRPGAPSSRSPAGGTPARPPLEPGPPGRASAVERPPASWWRAGGRERASATPAMMPMGAGVGSGRADQEHRRPDYLLDDSDAFADDRWFTGPVIGADDHVPVIREGR